MISHADGTDCLVVGALSIIGPSMLLHVVFLARKRVLYGGLRVVISFRIPSEVSSM